MYRGEKLFIPEDFDTTHGGIRAPIKHNIIENIMCQLGRMRVKILGFFTDEFFDEVAGFVVGVRVGGTAVGAHDCAFEAEAEGDGYAGGEGAGEGCGVGVVVEFCEEAEGAEGEG